MFNYVVVVLAGSGFHLVRVCWRPCNSWAFHLNGRIGLSLAQSESESETGNYANRKGRKEPKIQNSRRRSVRLSLSLRNLRYSTSKYAASCLARTDELVRWLPTHGKPRIKATLFWFINFFLLRPGTLILAKLSICWSDGLLKS
jgi:hypothetical protein